jgi:two-component system cell cycle response regulator
MPGRILIIDGIATNRISLRVRLCAAFYDVCQAASGAEGLEMLEQKQPDIVLISSTLPDMSASQLCQTLRAHPKMGDIGLVVLECAEDRTRRLEILAAGADDVMTRMADPRLLLARLRSLLRGGISRDDRLLQSQAVASTGFAEPARRFARPAHIAVLSEDAACGLTWIKRLEKERPYRYSLFSPRNLPRDFGRGMVPDVILIASSNQDEGDFGASLLATLGAQPGYRRSRFLIYVPDDTAEPAAQMLDLGAHDVMRGAFDPVALSLRLAQLLRRKARADQMHKRLQEGLHAALTDPLTGLHNRRYAMPELGRLIETAIASQSGLAVMLADLDHFKRINDHYGHAAGDAVLTEIARRLLGAVGADDLLARIGGEEFLIALPGLTRGEAQRAAQHLCRIVADTPVAVPGQAQPITVTVSIGLAMANPVGAQPQPATSAHILENPAESLLTRADQALYGAKTLGRNQVTTLDRPLM